MIETFRKLEQSGLIDDVILTYPTSTGEMRKGSLSSYNVTVRSIREIQPQRKTVTDSVWGMDGEYDFSTPETYSRRRFDIVFNIYAELGSVQDQRDRLVEWLKGADCRGKKQSFKNATKLEFSRRKNTYYSDIWVEIGNLDTPNTAKGRYYSSLSVTITTAPRYHKDGEQRI